MDGVHAPASERVVLHGHGQHRFAADTGLYTAMEGIDAPPSLAPRGARASRQISLSAPEVPESVYSTADESPPPARRAVLQR
jgi:hypothetical protein